MLLLASLFTLRMHEAEDGEVVGVASNLAQFTADFVKRHIMARSVVRSCLAHAGAGGANSMWLYANAAPLRCCCCAHAAGLRAQANTPVVGFFRQLQAMLPDLVPRITPPEATELAWAFAKAGLYCPDVFEHIREHHAAAAWEPQGACKALWAQAAMGVWCPEVAEHALREVHASQGELATGPKVLAVHSVASLALMHGLRVSDDTFQVRRLPC